MAVQPLAPSVMADYRGDLVVPSAPSFISESLPDIVPVRAIGSGVARPNARQAVKTYMAVKPSVGGEDFYIQIATVTPNTRVFYLKMDTSDACYVEDASTGNISPTDGSTVALADSGVGNLYPVVPRECKRGIRAKLTVGAGATGYFVIYYLEERTDGQQENL